MNFKNHQARFTRIAGLFIAYITPRTINQIIPFLLMPVTTRFVPPDSYGKYMLYATAVTFLTPFIGMSSWIHINRNFFTHSRAELADKISGVIVNILLSTGLCSLVILALWQIPGVVLPLPIFWLFMIPLISCASTFFLLAVNLLIIQQKAFRLALIEIIQVILSVLWTLFFVVGLRWNWQGMIVASMLNQWLFGFVGIVYLWRSGYLSFRPKLRDMREVFNISLPMIPHGLGYSIVLGSNYFFIEKFMGAFEVGIYSIACSFGIVVWLWGDAVYRLWAPWLMKRLSSLDGLSRQKVLRYSLLLYAAAPCVAALLSSAIAGLLPFLTAPAYHSARGYVFWFGMIYAADVMFKILLPFLEFKAATPFLGVNTALGACFNLAANYFLIRNFGLSGAITASLLTYVLMCGSVLTYISRLYRWSWLEAFKKPRELNCNVSV